MSSGGAPREPLLARLAAAVLDPVFHDGPFSRGERESPDAESLAAELSAPWPEPETSVSLLWCASGVVLADVLPGLWRQVRRNVPAEGVGCVDIDITIDVLGRLVAADIEAVPLAEVLSGVGEPEAAAAAAELPGLPAEVAIPALGDLFQRLLVAAQTG